MICGNYILGSWGIKQLTINWYTLLFVKIKFTFKLKIFVEKFKHCCYPQSIKVWLNFPMFFNKPLRERVNKLLGTLLFKRHVPNLPGGNRKHWRYWTLIKTGTQSFVNKLEHSFNKNFGYKFSYNNYNLQKEIFCLS